MASADARSGDRHQRNPVTYRPPEDLRERLPEYAEQTGRPVASVITEALRRYFAELDAATGTDTR